MIKKQHLNVFSLRKPHNSHFKMESNLESLVNHIIILKKRNTHIYFLGYIEIFVVMICVLLWAGKIYCKKNVFTRVISTNNGHVSARKSSFCLNGITS